jgi:hypothetical protein
MALQAPPQHDRAPGVVGDHRAGDGSFGEFAQEGPSVWNGPFQRVALS